MPHHLHDIPQEHLAIQHTFGKPPGWLVHWGIVAVSLFLLACLILAGIIRYPDILQATAVITTPHAPVAIVSKSDGQIQQLMVVDKQRVEKNVVLAVLRDAADWQNVLQLDTLMRHASISANIPPVLKLGDLAPFFENWRKSVKDMELASDNNTSMLQKQAIDREISKTRELIEGLERQQAIFKKELKNEESQLVRTRALFESGTVSLSDLERAETVLLQKQRAYEELIASTTNLEIRIQQLQNETWALERSNQEKIGNLENELEKNFQLLRQAIVQWKEEHLIQSPADGTLSLPFHIQPGLAVTTQMVLATVVPFDQPDSSIVIAKGPVLGAGKLEVGQKARIFLENYPPEEFGFLTGAVREISPIPTEGYYTLRLELTNGWHSSYGLDIPPQPSLQAQVFIATQDYSLLQRLVFILRSLKEKSLKL